MKVRTALTVMALLMLAPACSGTAAENQAKNEAPAFAEAARSPVPASAEAPVAAPSQSPTSVAADIKTAVPDLPVEDTPDNGVADAIPFPDEVTDFMVARDGCEHFIGEEPYDEERRAYLNENIRSLCTGTDAKLADLRRRYRKDAEVMAALKGYEEEIEGAPSPNE